MVHDVAIGKSLVVEEHKLYNMKPSRIKGESLYVGILVEAKHLRSVYQPFQVGRVYYSYVFIIHKYYYIRYLVTYLNIGCLCKLCN